MERSSLDADDQKPQPRTCGTCRNFDHKEGQRMLHTNPVFEEMIGTTMPRQFLGIMPDAPAYGCDWSELGACHVVASIRFPVDACDKWQPRLVEVKP